MPKFTLWISPTDRRGPVIPEYSARIRRAVADKKPALCGGKDRKEDGLLAVWSINAAAPLRSLDVCCADACVLPAGAFAADGLGEVGDDESRTVLPCATGPADDDDDDGGEEWFAGW
jgi:hypothetical protein